jgi:hypothetical protein
MEKSRCILANELCNALARNPHRPVENAPENKFGGRADGGVLAAGAKKISSLNIPRAARRIPSAASRDSERELM